MSFLLISVYLSILSVLIPLSLAVAQWKRIPREISELRWLLVAGLVFDIIGRTLGILKTNNLWVGDVFMCIQFTVLLYIFSKQFSSKIYFFIAYSVVVSFYAISLLFLDQTVKSLVRSNAVDGLVLIVISILFFFKLLSELKEVNIHRLPVLWIAFGTLFYYSGNLFVFLAATYLETDPDYLRVFWILHNVLNIVKNVLFAIALWQSYKLVKSSI